MFGRPAPKYALAVVYELVELGRKFWIMFCILSELILIDLWGGGGRAFSDTQARIWNCFSKLSENHFGSIRPMVEICRFPKGFFGAHWSTP